MLFYKRYFSVVVAWIWTMLLGCTAVQENDKHNAGNVIYTKESRSRAGNVLAHTGSSHIRFSDLELDPQGFEHDLYGMNLSFDIDMDQYLVDSLLKSHWDGVYVNVICNTMPGATFESKRYLNMKKRIYANRDQFISSAGHRHVDYIIPFRLLELSKGNHKVTLKVEILPVSLKSDTSVPEVKYIKKFEPAPLAVASAGYTVAAPQLFQSTLEVMAYKINTQAVDPQKFDFSVGGPGLPDLYWSLQIGNEETYRSPEEKNVINCKRPYKSKTFYCSSKDLITITIADLDNGPFNTEDDVVESWSAKYSDLQQGKVDTVVAGNLQYLIYRLDKATP